MERQWFAERGDLIVASDLLAPDPDLPRRDALLDVSFVADRLARSLGVPAGAQIGGVERIRAKYRFGRSLRVLHRMTVDQREHLVSTRMVTVERAPRLAAAAGAGVFDPDLHAVSWVFPHDRRLTGLDRLVEDATFLRTTLGVDARINGVVAYAPEKSVTLRCEDAAGRVIAYAKVYAEQEQAAEVHERYRRVAEPAAAVGLNLPRVIGFVPAHHLVVLAAMPGRRLDGLDEAELDVGLRGLGRALERLHRFAADAEEPFGRFTPDALQDAASLLAHARPDVGFDARALAGRLADERPFAASALVHGDVHLKNGLLAAGDVGLLDLDQCGRGHPAADVGGVLALLRQRRLVGELASTRFEHHEAAFLASYSEHGELDAHAVHWHTAAALLVERAARAVHRVLPRTLARLPALLREAHRVLADGNVAAARTVRP